VQLRLSGEWHFEEALAERCVAELPSRNCDLIMLLVVTREGYSREGWKSLAQHRLGLRVWWIAFFGTLLITVVATAAVWATPLASVTTPPGGVLNSVIQTREYPATEHAAAAPGGDSTLQDRHLSRRLG
jgi:hypothetical protein